MNLVPRRTAVGVAAIAVVLSPAVTADIAGAAPSASPGPRLVSSAPTSGHLVTPQRPTKKQRPKKKYKNYVALGDSYTAGPLIPKWRLDPAGCIRSTHNYPAYLAAYLRVKTYTDVSCSGARSRDMFAPQKTTIGPNDGGTNPAQLDALSTTTDLVTVGIGGNDFGLFGSVLTRCAQLAPLDPTGAPCKKHFTVNGKNKKIQKAKAIRAHIVRVVRTIHKRAPNATVMVVGYLRILPTSGTCKSIVPFATGDYAYGNKIQRTLNKSLRKAARKNHAKYVTMYPSSRGHDACAGSRAWVNGSEQDITRAAAYHPFKVGMKAIAAASYTRLTGKKAPHRRPFDSGAPTLRTRGSR